MNSDLPINILNRNKILLFIVQNVRMGIYLNDIDKVLPLIELKTIPAAPHYLVGIMNLKGKSIPIIDTALKVGLTRTHPYSLTVHILLCNFKNKIVGLVVDEIIGITDIDESTIQMKDKFTKNGTASFIGTFIHNFETILLLNMEYLISHEQMAYEEKS